MNASLATVQNPILTAAIQACTTIKNNVDGNADYVQQMLNAFSDEQLKSLNVAFGGSGSKDYKSGVFKNMVFAQELKNIKNMIADSEIVKEAMCSVVIYALVKGYGNERGEVPWVNVQTLVVDVLNARSHARGIAANAAMHVG